MQLYAKGVARYTGTGEATTLADPVILELLAVLKTFHAVTISPGVITLDEDNNYTTFVAVEPGIKYRFFFENFVPSCALSI